MAKMKSRNKFPPGSFQVLHPEAAMKQPYAGSFNDCVKWEWMWRQRNPALAQKLGLLPDEAHVAAWVDEQNALRCIANGHVSFVDLGLSPEPIANVAQKKSLLGRVVGAARKGEAAISAYMAMFGEKGPVAKDVAERRAAVCVDCPQNNTKGGLQDFFTKAAAEQIMGILGAMRDLDLRTSQHDKLGVCEACECPIQAKCFVPTDNLLKKTPEEIWPRLRQGNPNCWALKETGH